MSQSTLFTITAFRDESGDITVKYEGNAAVTSVEMGYAMGMAAKALFHQSKQTCEMLSQSDPRHARQFVDGYAAATAEGGPDISRTVICNVGSEG